MNSKSPASVVSFVYHMIINKDRDCVKQINHFQYVLCISNKTANIILLNRNNCVKYFSVFKKEKAIYTDETHLEISLTEYGVEYLNMMKL